jgi:hypothetical protein
VSQIDLKFVDACQLLKSHIRRIRNFSADEIRLVKNFSYRARGVSNNRFYLSTLQRVKKHAQPSVKFAFACPITLSHD